MSRLKLFFGTVAALSAILTMASKCQAQVTTKFSGGTLKMVTTGLNNNIIIEGLGQDHLKATINGEPFEWEGVKHIKIDPSSKFMSDFPNVWAEGLRISGNFSFTGLRCNLDGSNFGGHCDVETIFTISMLNTYVNKNCSLTNNGGYNIGFMPNEELTVSNCIVNGNAKLNGSSGIFVDDSLFLRNLNTTLADSTGAQRVMFVSGNSIVGNMTLDGGPENGLLWPIFSPSVVSGKTRLKRFSDILPGLF